MSIDATQKIKAIRLFQDLWQEIQLAFPLPAGYNESRQENAPHTKAEGGRTVTRGNDLPPHGQKRKMRKRAVYCIVFLALLAAEIGIALFVRDNFVRPYVGDALVTVLLCCLVRCIFPHGPKWLAAYVFIFSVAVEFSQLAGIATILGVKSTVLRTLLGATFDPKDILCYFVGCMAFGAAEGWFSHRRRKKEGGRDTSSSERQNDGTSL